MRQKNPSLRTVLKYENEKVLAQFMYRFGINRRTSSIVFQDMLRFLWISNRVLLLAGRKSSQAPEFKNFPLFAGWIIIDEMWHTFILNSLDYKKFCEDTFGCFINHGPADRRKRRKSATVEEYPSYELCAKYLKKTFDNATTNRWLYSYPNRYDAITLQKLHLKALKKNL